MRKFNLTWGIILLVFGSLLLLDNLNVFSFLGVSIWKILWPLGLIALGGWILWATQSAKTYGEEQEVAVPANDSEEYTVNVQYGAGELFIDGKFDTPDLVHCKSYGGLLHKVKESGNVKHIQLRTPTNLGQFGLFIRRKWNLTLDGSLPCELTINTGACETRADLTDTMVHALRIETGASSTRIKLPENAGVTTVRGSGGAASLSLIIPPEVAAHIEVKGGIYSANIDQQRFPKHGHYYESPNYEQAVNKVDIKYDMGLGSVDIR
jgi:hypothetical protein